MEFIKAVIFFIALLGTTATITGIIQAVATRSKTSNVGNIATIITILLWSILYYLS